MVKTLATSVVLFLSLFFATFANGQAVAPTLGRNNVWTGTNSFLYHNLVLNQGNSCGSGQAMVGYNADFTPICAAFAGGGVNTLNGLTGTVIVTNGDSNISVGGSGQSITISCPGCTGGGGSSPGGSTGALQYNAGSGNFGGVNITGLVFGQGSGAPRQAVAGTDYQAPLILACTGGISCPPSGNTYNFTYSGAAGSGSVSTANYGQVTGYAAQGTTVSGIPNVYFASPSWSLNQLNALFSRFNGVSITNCSVTANVVTLTGLNSYSVGDQVFFTGLSTCSVLNGFTLPVISTGLSQSQFEVDFSTSNVSGAETGYGLIGGPNGLSNGLVIVPQGLADNTPATAYTNTFARVWDARKGYGIQQASQYGLQCGIQSFFANVTSGSNQINVGSSLSASNVGQTVIIAQQVGYGNTGLQEDWEPTITGYSFPNITVSGNAPFNFSGTITVGTNNQAALQRAVNDAGGVVPLWLPQCPMLTDTIRWNGTSFIGQQMNFTDLIGFPAHDILQQQDYVPITAWSINTGTGVTTFTIPSYAAHSILPGSLYPTGYGQPTGDSVTLAGFPTSTFFNNQTVSIATHPTPTTFTVNSVFGRSTSSATEAGVAQPTTGADENALLIENTTFSVNNSIDGSFTWNHYTPAAAEVVEPPYYRPLLENGVNMNDPLAPGWGVGVGGGNTTNGVANITQNSAVICVPTTLAVLPTVGSTLVFPYQTGGLFSATVSSTAGSCSGGFDPFTLSAAFPNTSGYTATQAEWFDYGTPQTLSVSMPGTISLPYTITLNLPLTIISGWISNAAPHGRVIIGTQEWDYMGINYGGTDSGSPQLVLRNGPTTVNGGSGYSGGTVVFPLNPCQAMYNNPWPVVPTINGANSTPVKAEYYAGICGANAAISLPSVDGVNAAFNNPGLNLAHLSDVSGQNTTTNALGNASNNGSMMIYEAGNYTGYGNTFDDLRGNGLMGGFMQGPSSVDQYGVSAVGPTSTGQSINNCTFRTGYSIALVNMQQGGIHRCDNYSNETSPYDGTSVGSSTALFLGFTLSEKTGAGVTSLFQNAVNEWNAEPENGNHFEFPPSVEAYGNNTVWSANIFEGGFNVFGGSFQQIHGTQMSGPIFNYGSNNYFDTMNGLNLTYIDSNVYNGSLGFYNWGSFTSCQGVFGGAQGPGVNRTPGVGCVQSYNGHDVWASMMGNNVNPTENILGGMISPDEFSFSGATTAFDNTELWWGKHFECGISTSAECIYQSFGSSFILIGPHERITNTQMVLKANVKLKTSGTATFEIQIAAPNGLSNATCTPNFAVTNATFTATSAGWTPIQMPVDFSNLQGCNLQVQVFNGSATNTLEVGYFNFVPFTGQLYIPLGTPTDGTSCPVAGEFKLDTTNEWICRPLTGHAFGAGTWGHVAITP